MGNYIYYPIRDKLGGGKSQAFQKDGKKYVWKKVGKKKVWGKRETEKKREKDGKRKNGGVKGKIYKITREKKGNIVNKSEKEGKRARKNREEEV